jgi:transposase InsO family protein
MKSFSIMDLESRVTGIVGRGMRRGDVEPEGRPEVPPGQKLMRRGFRCREVRTVAIGLKPVVLRVKVPRWLTTTTFKHAATRQRPLAGLIHHSDRGSQYAADAFQQCLRAWSVTPSMSRQGNPYDNALAESFVATLKTECFADSIAPTKPPLN